MCQEIVNGARQSHLLSEPAHLHSIAVATDENRVPSNLTQIGSRKLPHLLRNGVPGNEERVEESKSRDLSHLCGDSVFGSEWEARAPCVCVCVRARVCVCMI
jgi:hypothetical protein